MKYSKDTLDLYFSTKKELQAKNASLMRENRELKEEINRIIKQYFFQKEKIQSLERIFQKYF